MQTVFIHAHIEVVENVLDDLTKGQRYDGQIVTPKPKHRDANDDACSSGADRAHNDTDEQPKLPNGHQILQAHGCHNAGERANAHKSGMSQTQLAGNTDGQVQGHSHTDVHADGHQLTLQGVGNAACVHKALDHNIKQDHDQVCDKIAAGGFA